MENLIMVKAFGALEDPRNTETKNFLYPLGEILLVAFATILSGGRTYVDMCLFGNSKLNYNGEFIGIDGKKLRRSKKRGRNPLHVINAWAHKNRVVLGCKAVSKGGSEIATVPEVLNMLSLKGTIVTIDAMGSQTTDIINQIVEQKGDYVVSLKRNQPKLYENIKAHFENEKNNEKVAIYETIEKDHGRIEKRKYGFTADISDLKKKSDSKWHT